MEIYNKNMICYYVFLNQFIDLWNGIIFYMGNENKRRTNDTWFYRYKRNKRIVYKMNNNFFCKDEKLSIQRRVITYLYIND